MNDPKGSQAIEVNFDGIVGPTHNYSGLSYGNVASLKHQSTVSHPKEAALQGLEKMKRLADLGIAQAVLPPHERPHLPTLRSLGFVGNDREVIAAAALKAPQVLVESASASAMWTANAATVCPSSDSGDGKVHLTTANLAAKFHRSIEPSATSGMLKAIFADKEHFTNHSPLPGGCQFSDEGAANHTRFCREYGGKGVHLFVYGRKALGAQQNTPKRFPARQSLEASEAVARLHGLTASSAIFAQQNPDAIDAGAFHNDVVSVGNKNLFLFHEDAFMDKGRLLNELSTKMHAQCRTEIALHEVKRGRITLKEAIDTYLFNSQILSLPDSTQLLLAPKECQEHSVVRSYLDELAAKEGSGIDRIDYVNLHQSMNNGGGPACLRLRVVLTPNEYAKINQGVILNNALYLKLVEWVKRHYRDQLHPKDLSDPLLYEEGCAALDELTQLLGIGPIYEFQKIRSKQPL